MSSPQKNIAIVGAKEHNLKNISLKIPRNQLVIFTGLSGSGKSSLAFDTIYAEGQRRYLESLSAYARQFLEQLQKPAVESIEGLSPAISIEQKNISRNPRSTVGTVTEVYDFLRLLYARTGKPHCPECGALVQSQTVNQMTEKIYTNPEGTKLAILAPIARAKKGEFQKELALFRNRGFSRARIDGIERELSEPIKLKKTFKHDISVYIDRFVLKPQSKQRIYEALELCLDVADGLAEVELITEKKSILFSSKFACLQCGTNLPEIEPRSFSFNSEHGACAKCDGIGSFPKVLAELVVPNPELSLLEGAIAPWADKNSAWLQKTLEPIAKAMGFSLDTPFAKLPDLAKEVLLSGSGDKKFDFSGSSKKSTHTFHQAFAGVIHLLELSLKEDPQMFSVLEPFLSSEPCPECKGARLKKESLFVKVSGLNIAELSALPLGELKLALSNLKISPSERVIVEPILKEIFGRLDFIDNVGLAYLSLSRSAATLSGGEAQRIRLATQIGSNLVGVLYVLDEPSIGLHQKDNERLLNSLIHLRDQGNSLIVVEHDEETIRKADYLVDLGPGAGEHGGHLVFAGTPKEISKAKDSLTYKYLSGELSIPVPSRRKKDSSRVLSLKNCSLNNLKNFSVDIPIGLLNVITGVSGSGKSSLIIDTLLKNLQHYFSYKRKNWVGAQSIEGLDHIDRIIHVDQAPIGRTPRSNPATYSGLFSDIRNLYASLPEARARGYTPGRFSFNVASGRCEACSGDGTLTISMNFLPDVFVTCEVCQGKRYNQDTLKILYKGKSIADVLQMSIEQAHLFFEKIPQLRERLKTLVEVGLGYIQLGQSSVTLSGGEAQRIKLARELSKRTNAKSLYILDEPTTGLHFEDVRKLLLILQKLADQGSTVIVIEHHLDVIKQADWVIDLGPEGGQQGGEVLFEGTPEELAQNANSYTGIYLKPLLKPQKKKTGPTLEASPVKIT